MDFLAFFGCDTTLVFARCRHTTNSLCNVDGDFGICILTWHEHPSAQWAFIHALLSCVSFALGRLFC